MFDNMSLSELIKERDSLIMDDDCITPKMLKLLDLEIKRRETGFKSWKLESRML